MEGKCFLFVETVEEGLMQRCGGRIEGHCRNSTEDIECGEHGKLELVSHVVVILP